METIKKIIGATVAVFLLMTLMSKSLSAQELPSVAKFDNIVTTNEDGKVVLTWTSLDYKDAHYFIVEKLDENWDFQTVGKVSAHPMNVNYTMSDENPLDGENYYRITVVMLKGEMLQSELMVADYFEPAPAIDFIPEVSNSMIARSMVEKSLKDSELVNPKYTTSQLALNRLLVTSATGTERVTFGSRLANIMD